jgi:hypothetical protein
MTNTYTHLTPAFRFTPDKLMEMVPNVGSIIDLTATDKYYNPAVRIFRIFLIYNYNNFFYLLHVAFHDAWNTAHQNRVRWPRNHSLRSYRS